MRYIFIYTAIIFVSISQSQGRDPEWFKRRSNDLENAIKIENMNDRINALGAFMSLGSHGEMDEEKKMIFNRAQAELLSIPGHAKYYQDKIEEMRAGVLADSKKSAAEIARMQDHGEKVFWEPVYSSYAESTLRTLRYMPSAETVAVLGHFLNDPEGRDGKTAISTPRRSPGDDFDPHPSNAEAATSSLRHLGIETPPFRNPDGAITDEEIDAWKDWWNEVKEGKRTYRFIGSKVEYGPEGPASKEVIQHAERDRKRDEERETGHRKSSTAAETGATTTVAAKPLSIAGILAAFALVGGAVWYYLRGRRAA